ncbi:MAG: ABC transporter permease [Cryomorphaceae bacterium]|nr:MAG: ABC transporter permease [Cryomorphaceae bacterium]
MNIFKLSIKNIISKPLNSILSLALLILGIGIISLLLQLNSLIKTQMDNNLKGIDMVVGAKGSPLQLILSAVYHIDSPTGNISVEDAEEIKNNRMVGSSIDLLYGDNYKGYRIVGTEDKFLDLYNAKIKDGKKWNAPFEVVVGAKIYSKLNINLDDELVSSHGLRETGESHVNQSFKVVGLLEPSNSVVDQLIITSPQSIWDLHDEHDHDDEDHEEHHDDEDHEEHEHDHDDEDHDEHEHDHDDEDHDEHEHGDKEITAMLIKFKSPMNIIQFPRQINENTNLQAAVPSYEISRLFKLFGFGIETLTYLAYLIILVSGFSLFINLFNSMRERKYEMALIRTLGASRSQLSVMVIFESLILTISGFLLGLLVSRLGVMFVSSLMEESLNYSLSSLYILNEEFWLLGLSILIGLISSLIPAIQVYKMNISEILADE